ncbi:hypothetical protein [Hyphomonas atlantica corrig.]|uniref:hypothetical protein n=2 Tax=Hyphomonas atlantica TaxID=1280948 RepID=UPI002355B8D1|nr:hypothetical protein [Hyphomonas atlantica]
MKYPALMLSALLVILPANAEFLDVDPVMNAFAQQCGEALPGMEPACGCITANVRNWVSRTDAGDQQVRLWMLMSDALRGNVPDDQIYERASVAGVSREALSAAEIKYFDVVDDLFMACASQMTASAD